MTADERGAPHPLPAIPARPLRRFVVLGRRASASPDFSLEDLPSSSGRLDVLLRCLRAALLLSHGLRRECVVYLVLMGGPAAPRTLRFEGESVRFLRPDERSLATLVRKVLAAPLDGDAFVTVRPGIAAAQGGLSAVARDAAAARFIVLDEGGVDLRAAAIPYGDVAFVLGDDLGFDAPMAEALAALAPERISVGPRSIHADDAIAVVHNELDRRDAARARERRDEWAD